MDNSRSLFRDMIQTTLDQDLNKTELQVFLVLLMQTLGFGKASDPLTYGRIAHTMHKRKDHVKSAIKTLLNAEIFDATKHPRFEFSYQIGAKFLSKHRGDFFTPTLPKTGEGFRKMEAFSENREHTALYLDNPLSLQLQTNPTENDCAKNKKVQLIHCCGGCCKNLKNIKPTSPTEKPAPNAQTTKPIVKADSKAHSAHSNEIPPASSTARVHSKTVSTHPDEIPHTLPNDKPPFDWTGVTLPTLPDSIRPENHAFIHGLFKKGTQQQAENALVAYADMQKKRFVHSPTGLLRRLAEWSQTDNKLTLPDVVENTFENDPRHMPLHPSHQPFNPDPLAHLSPEARAKYQLKEDIEYLTHVAKVENKSMAETAKLMRMEHVLPHITREEVEAVEPRISPKDEIKTENTISTSITHQVSPTDPYKGTLSSLLQSILAKNVTSESC